jgi:hypothetical protein
MREAMMRKLKNPKAIGYCLKCDEEIERPSQACKCQTVTIEEEPETFDDWFAEDVHGERCGYCSGRHRTRLEVNNCMAAFVRPRLHAFKAKKETA